MAPKRLFEINDKYRVETDVKLSYEFRYNIRFDNSQFSAILASLYYKQLLVVPKM